MFLPSYTEGRAITYFGTQSCCSLPPPPPRYVATVAAALLDLPLIGNGITPRSQHELYNQDTCLLSSILNWAVTEMVVGLLTFAWAKAFHTRGMAVTYILYVIRTARDVRTGYALLSLKVVTTRKLIKLFDAVNRMKNLRTRPCVAHHSIISL